MHLIKTSRRDDFQSIYWLVIFLLNNKDLVGDPNLITHIVMENRLKKKPKSDFKNLRDYKKYYSLTKIARYIEKH